MNKKKYTRLIDCAAGRIPADTVFTNCHIIHVFTGDISQQDVAVIDGHIAGIGSYHGKQNVDLEGKYLCPGFIDGHIHIESSMLTPVQFGAAVLPHGTTTVICDPHEIANVCGIKGVEYMLSQKTPLSIYAMAPSCVPATHMETSGAIFQAEDIGKLLDHSRVIGLAEMMNFPGTVAALDNVSDIILQARDRGVLIDGHAPGLTGQALQAYLAAGISSDHECTDLEEALEKIRYGMAVFIREGSTARNLKALMPLLESATAHRCLLVTDDRHADDLLNQGHMDYILRQAVELGADPVTAIQMVTLNPAKHFGLQYVGAIAPGYRADITVLDDIENFNVDQVYCSGRIIARHGTMSTQPAPQPVDSLDPLIVSSVRILPQEIDLSIPAVVNSTLNVISCTEGQIVTKRLEVEPTVQNGCVVSDVEQDILKIAVIERHRGSQRVGLGFVHGLGLQKGALASTVAHDSHNLIVVGTTDAAMEQAIQEIVEMQGGLVVAEDDGILASVALPVAGLMSNSDARDVQLELQQLNKAMAMLGPGVSNPFMLLSFLALPVIPELKITDHGLVDVMKFEIVDLQMVKK